MANNKKKTVKNDGSYIFSDFSNGLYLLDTPRGLGEQLASLAIVGGRNIWAERGALVAQYGYVVKGEIPQDDQVIAMTNDSVSGSSCMILTILGNVYNYTAVQGLKKYKTKFEPIVDKPMVARFGADMIAYIDDGSYIFGGYYEDSELVPINNNVVIDDYATYYELHIPKTDEQYYWNGKKLAINETNQVTVTSVIENGRLEDEIIVRVVANTEHIAYTENVSVGERALKPITLVYEPEDTSLESHTITPELLAVSNNRLFVVDITGDIYYSRVGVIDDFQQKYGAGFFGGFYNDVSKILSIEEYLSGTLIAKQNGIYHLTIGDSVSIQKVAQVGQQYATDHVIVREKVYCYDSNSSQIVIAAQQNVFGSIVSGKTIITAEYLNAQDYGITESERFLTFNAEANILTLYYGVGLKNGIILTDAGTLFPRELDESVFRFIGFNQGVLGITDTGKIFQDFKKGTIVNNISPYVEFEAIGLRDNRMICSSILEITELNGVDYDVIVTNSGTSTQKIIPPNFYGVDDTILPPMLYSEYDRNKLYNTYSEESKWVEKRSNVTRIYAPMSGNNGVSISLQFPEDVAFCLAALRLPDFSQGE